MHRCLWLCFLLCFCFDANGQISDSLYKALTDTLRPKNKLIIIDSERIRIIQNTSPAFVYQFYREIEAMAFHLEKAISKVKTNEDKMPYAFGIAEFYSRTGRMAQNVYWYKQVIDYGKRVSVHHRILCESYLNVAIAYAFQEKQDLAVSLLHTATNIAIADRDSVTLRNTYYVYIPIYKKLQLYHQALTYSNKYLKALPGSEKWSPSYIEVMMTKANLYGWLYRDEKKPAYADSTKALIKEVMKATQKEEAYWYQNCYGNLGLLHYFLGDYQTALHYYDLSLSPKYNQAGSYQTDLLYKAKLYRSLCLVQMGKESSVAEALTIDVPPKDYATRQELNKVLAYYYVQREAYKQALDHYTKYKLYADSSDVIGQKGKVFEAEQKYSVAQKEAAIAQLENKNLQAEATRNKIIVASILSILLLSWLFYVRSKRQQVQRVAERQKLTDELHKIEDEMNFQSAQEQAEKAMAMIEQRKIISQNMHDEVSSSLVTLQYYVADLKQQAKDKEMSRVLDDIEQETHQVYLQVRDFMHWLYNSAIQAQYNVVDFLRSLSLRFGEGSSLSIRTEVDEENIRRYFTPLHHNETYRMIKEAVTNSMKHSGATQLVIKLLFSKGVFYFSIMDNGKGFTTTNSDGMGMKTLVERITTLNGKLQLNSTSAGTELSGSFPIVKPD